MTAHLSPEEIEDGKINEAYQGTYEMGQKNECAGAVEKYRRVVIPLAEKARYDVPRNKFLFLAFRGIGDCELSLKNFVEAEQAYGKSLDYAPVWPGVDDSAYPIEYRSIGIARMGQQNWQGAEESLVKSIAIFDQLIEKAIRSDLGYANLLRDGEDDAFVFLAAAYFRQHRPADALALLEKAYGQAMKYNASAVMLKQIVNDGLEISVATGNGTASATWSERAKALK